MKDPVPAGFSLREPEVVELFAQILANSAGMQRHLVPVYRFMNDHQHFILTGEEDHSDLWKSVVTYKQKTGFWLSCHKAHPKWQKDFYDHLVRAKQDVVAQVRYILDNPVRKGLASSWEEYPYTGSIGCKLEDVLKGLL